MERGFGSIGVMDAGAPISTRLRVLDGWRAVSVVIVIWSHIWLYSSMRVPTMPLSHHGGLGVELFFGISGFVITRGLADEFRKFGRVSLSAFYLRRAFRILPPLLLYIVVVTAVWRAGLVETDPGLFRALTFTCNIGECGGWLGAHTWSLSVEEQFYIFIPALLAATLATRRYMVSLIALALPSAIILISVLHLPPFSISVEPQYTALLSQFMTIFFGVVAALHEERLKAWVSRAPVWLWIVALAAVLTLWAQPPGRFISIVRVFSLGPLVMTILLASAWRPSVLTRWLEWPAVQGLGRVSYGIYLYQQLATYAFPGVHWPFYLASVALCIAAAFGSFHFLERPLSEVGRRLSDKRKQGAGQVSSA